MGVQRTARVAGVVFASLSALALACGDDGGPAGAPDGSTEADGGTPQAGDAGAPAVERDAAAALPDGVYAPGLHTHAFPAREVPAGHEDTGLCLSWTLHNDEALWVQSVEFRNDGALHHSNWIFVDESRFDGEDGWWPCAERGFGLIDAAIGGGVFFAQSTQARSDLQSFGEGVAFRMPARARVVGQMHLLNAGEAAVSTAPSFEVRTIAADEVRTELNPMAYTNTALDVAAATTTSATMDCAMFQPDFSLHYVLPHYHALGTGMTIEVVGGPEDGREVFRSSVAYGEPGGETFDPPIELTGVEALRIRCDYDNPGDAVVTYGPSGADEMCVVLLFTDSMDAAGGFAVSNAAVEDVDGVHRTTADCLVIRRPAVGDAPAGPEEPDYDQARP